MSRAFEQRELLIPISRAIREDLHAMMQTFNGGEYNYWSPRTKEGHSDICTAYALALRAASGAEGNVMVDTDFSRDVEDEEISQNGRLYAG